MTFETHETALRDLRARFRGTLIDPAHDDFETARQVRNACIDLRPLAIARCADADDVAEVVRFARERDLPIAVRSGAHDFGGRSTVEGGIVADLGALNDVRVDAAAREAVAGPGTRAGDFCTITTAQGLCTPLGDTASVGLGGLTLGGGIGYLARRHGLTIDNLLSAEIVTADGERLTASETENGDLFWAIRGGGGNFGIATSFRYRLHDVSMIFGGAIAFPPTVDAIRGSLEWAANAPEEATMISMLMHLPPAPFIPPEAQGKLAYVALVCVLADAERGAEIVRPLRAHGPMMDMLGVMPYTGLYAFAAEAEKRSPEVGRSTFLRSMSDSAIEAMLEAMQRTTAPMAMVQLRVLGGAVERVHSSATAFGHRDWPYIATAIVPFEQAGDLPMHQEWAHGLFTAIRPEAAPAYVNFLGDEGEARIGDAYPPATYARLAQIKHRYDPTNLFRLNQNVKPSA